MIESPGTVIPKPNRPSWIGGPWGAALTFVSLMAITATVWPRERYDDECGVIYSVLVPGAEPFGHEPPVVAAAWICQALGITDPAVGAGALTAVALAAAVPALALVHRLTTSVHVRAPPLVALLVLGLSQACAAQLMGARLVYAVSLALVAWALVELVHVVEEPKRRWWRFIAVAAAALLTHRVTGPLAPAGVLVASCVAGRPCTMALLSWRTAAAALAWAAVATYVFVTFPHGHAAAHVGVGWSPMRALNGIAMTSRLIPVLAGLILIGICAAFRTSRRARLLAGVVIVQFLAITIVLDGFRPLSFIHLVPGAAVLAACGAGCVGRAIARAARQDTSSWAAIGLTMTVAAGALCETLLGGDRTLRRAPDRVPRALLARAASGWGWQSHETDSRWLSTLAGDERAWDVWLCDEWRVAWVHLGARGERFTLGGGVTEASVIAAVEARRRRLARGGRPPRTLVLVLNGRREQRVQTIDRALLRIGAVPLPAPHAYAGAWVIE